MTKRSPLFLSRNYSVSQLLEKQSQLNEYTLAGWKGLLTPDHYATQIIAEADELLGSGVNYKWWKFSDPSTFDLWNVKIEGIDIVHFYLSMIVLWQDAEAHVTGCSCDSDMLAGTTFAQYRDTFIATSEGIGTGALIEGVNQLNHRNFMYHLRAMLFQQGSVHDHIHVLNDFVMSLGLRSEEFSALYASKSKLNEIRQENGYKTGTYVKVNDGIEDNQKLESLVSDFLAQTDMTLEQLRQNVFEAFYDVTPTV